MDFIARSRWCSAASAALVAGVASACAPSGDATTTLAVDTPLHLEEQLDAATVDSAGPPLSVLEERAWSFDSEQPEWTPLPPRTVPWFGASTAIAPIDDALRVSLEIDPGAPPAMMMIGGIRVDVGDAAIGDFETILVRARTVEPVESVAVAVNLEHWTQGLSPMDFFLRLTDIPPMFSDGSVQTYAIPVRPPGELSLTSPLADLTVLFAAFAPASVDVLSVTLVPTGAGYADTHGVRSDARGEDVRRVLYAHAPARLQYPLRVPEGGRFDFGLGVARADQPVTYRVTAAASGDSEVLFEETYDDAQSWGQRSVDLSSFSGQTVTLALEAEAAEEGAAAVWAAPTVSGASPGNLPNVIFYVIDGAGADFMSVYGYNRRTTPNMERLATEGAVFERAHANATWTQPSTASFMTSLQHSVLGGLRRGIHSTPVPTAATTMAEHMHRAGYQTASLTTNPNAGRVIGVERGVDVFSDEGDLDHGESSLRLHERYWDFRDAYPGQPYWVHFQTTDVHEPHQPVPPFAGLWVDPERRRRFEQWNREVQQNGDGAFTTVHAYYRRMLASLDIDARTYYEAQRGLYDETMAHQDYRLGQLVDRLKQQGEWERTLLVIGADHGHPAGTFARFGRGLLEPEPPDWEGALFGSFETRVPLIIVWPGRIEGGQRFAQPVSMIDVLPTILDLVDLPQPDVLQGQSLAPLLLGEPGWEARPVILDEFRVDNETGEMIGNLEMIDGRWGASLEIGPRSADLAEGMGRHATPVGGRWGAGHPFFPEIPRLLLYDLWNDPLANRHVNDEYPDLVEKYTRLLNEQWEAHVALAGQFTGADEAALTPEQLRTLRALGYIR